MVLDEKVKQIIEWQESLSQLSDEYFFDLIRIYLGPVKTPFNKQNIIKNLSSFLRKDDNKRLIVSFLSDAELKILSVFFIVDEGSPETLFPFFRNSKTFPEFVSTGSFYEKLANLEDRLVLFRLKKNGDYVLKINPLLKDGIKARLEKVNMFSDSEVAFPVHSGISLLPDFFAAFFSYINLNPELCRADGTVKKKDFQKIEEIFMSENLPRFLLLLKAFRNNGLIYETSSGVKLNDEKLNSFSSLSFLDMCILVCASSCGHFSKSTVMFNAEVLKTSVCALLDHKLKKDDLFSSIQIINGKLKKEHRSEMRFASMMSQVFSDGNSTDMSELLLEAALTLGLFSVCGKTEEGEFVYEVNRNVYDFKGVKNAKVCRVDAAGKVALMPALSLEELLPLARFLKIVRFDNVAIYEITRESISRAFDAGSTEKSVTELLEKYSLYSLPQSLLVNIQDWAASYGSASLYYGFVLRVDEKNTLLVENNPALKNHILEKIAGGVYLLDFTSKTEALSVVQKCGLEFLGKILEPPTAEYSPSLSFSDVPVEDSFEHMFDIKKSENAEEDFSLKPEEKISELKAVLSKMQMSDYQREGLLMRIESGLIISESQLNPDSVRFERTEASAMDHTGKLQIIESAVSNGNLLVLSFDSDKEGILVKPLSVDKKSPSVSLIAVNQDSGEQKSFSVSKIVHIKKIRRLFSRD